MLERTLVFVLCSGDYCRFSVLSFIYYMLLNFLLVSCEILCTQRTCLHFSFLFLPQTLVTILYFCGSGKYCQTHFYLPF